MFCTRCGTPFSEDAQFCTRCGAPARGASPATPLPEPSVPPVSPLTTASHFVLLWDKFALPRNFQFEDPSGTPLGETRGEFGVLPKYTVVDSAGTTVFGIDSRWNRGRGIDLRVLDPTGAVLAVLRAESSFLSRRFAIVVGENEGWSLRADATGYQYTVEEAGNVIPIATGIRKMALRTSRTTIDISPTANLDRRVILAAMVLAVFTSDRR